VASFAHMALPRSLCIARAHASSRRRARSSLARNSRSGAPLKAWHIARASTSSAHLQIINTRTAAALRQAHQMAEKMKSRVSIIFAHAPRAHLCVTAGARRNQNAQRSPHSKPLRGSRVTHTRGLIAHLLSWPLRASRHLFCLRAASYKYARHGA